MIVEHYHMMLGHYGIETGVNMARKHLGWYTKGLPGSAEFRNTVNQIADPARVLAMLDEFYRTMAIPGGRLIRFTRRGAGEAETPGATELLGALPTAMLVIDGAGIVRTATLRRKRC